MHGSHKPDEAERRKWQNPEAILKRIGLKTGWTFVDVGCGSGYFALPAARITGKQGCVWGIDSKPGLIDGLRQTAEKEGLTNLKLVTGNAEDLAVCRHCADVVFFGVVLHDFLHPEKVLANARLMLKPGGKLVNLDWKQEPLTFGPPVQKKFSLEEAVRLIQTAGFEIKKAGEDGIYHYMITAVI